MQLIIDLGNTRLKFSIFHKNELQNNFSIEPQKLEEFLTSLSEFHFSSAIISSVIEIPKLLLTWLNKREIEVLVLGPTIKLPFNNTYKTPQTLGNDRIANAAAATFLYPNQNVMVADFGTCLKLDYVSSKNKYLGGTISPGIRLRSESMHEKTAQLPLLQTNEVLKFAKSIGKSTHEAMAGGVYWGMIHEVMGAFQAFQAQYSPAILVLTGGDLVGLAFPEKKFIFAHPNFTRIGLNTILLYNQNTNLEF